MRRSRKPVLVPFSLCGMPHTELDSLHRHVALWRLQGRYRGFVILASRVGSPEIYTMFRADRY